MEEQPERIIMKWNDADIEVFRDLMEGGYWAQGMLNDCYVYGEGITFEKMLDDMREAMALALEEFD